MVEKVQKSKEVAKLAFAPEPRSLSAHVMLSEVLAAGARLDAAAFGIEAHKAVEVLKASNHPLIVLLGENGFCHETNDVIRFRRSYVGEAYGLPFLSSSDIISMRPEINHYLSRKLTKRLNELVIKKWEVLISRSGTVGNVSLAGSTHAGSALSEHAIRLRSDSPEESGYIAAFLRSKFGRPQLIGASYGSVVVHIEPSHLTRTVVPDLHPIMTTEIGRNMCDAVDYRDEANQLLNEADERLHTYLGLSPLKEVQASTARFTTVQASNLQERFEASFHDAAAYTAIEKLAETKTEITTIDDPRVVAEIRPITKFRKRVYVRHGGIPLISSKQLFQIDPVDVKHLAKGAHTKDLKEIALETNMILVTRSGTTGRVQIVPKYMNGWAASEHATRLIAAERMNPGYLYAWLSSDYGAKLVKRNDYGSVILEIDKDMFGSVPVPLLEPAKMTEIGDLVLKANDLRDKAWGSERDAITRLEAYVEGERRQG